MTNWFDFISSTMEDMNIEMNTFEIDELSIRIDEEVRNPKIKCCKHPSEDYERDGKYRTVEETRELLR